MKGWTEYLVQTAPAAAGQRTIGSKGLRVAWTISNLTKMTIRSTPVDTLDSLENLGLRIPYTCLCFAILAVRDRKGADKK